MARRVKEQQEGDESANAESISGRQCMRCPCSSYRYSADSWPSIRHGSSVFRLLCSLELGAEVEIRNGGLLSVLAVHGIDKRFRDIFHER